MRVRVWQPGRVAPSSSRMTTLILAVYIVLLALGGVMGFVKAGSKVSLITAAVFAAALALCVWGPVPNGRRVAQVLQALLVIVFALRYQKTKKFMPAGFMLAATVLALVLELALAG